MFLGLGPKPRDEGEYETTGSGEQPETGRRISRVPDTMTAVPAVRLAGVLAPGFADVVAHAVNESGSGGVVTSAGLAAVAVTRSRLLAAPDWALPLRRLQSGHVGDYVARVLVGAAVLGAPALPGVLGT